MKSARGKREACMKRSTRTMGSTMLVVFHAGLSSSLFGGGQAGSDLNLFLFFPLTVVNGEKSMRDDPNNSCKGLAYHWISIQFQIHSDISRNSNIFIVGQLIDI